jgi:flavin reductase (DIM6/NTAB) family NADH-FMN oxidoreductase RutF
VRVAVELRRAYRLLNHGPATLVSAAHGSRHNVMAAQWVMPLDFDPPKLAVVVAADTFTRGLIEASGQLCVSLPTVGMADLVWAVGSASSAEVDKLERFHVATTQASKVTAPLIDGCVAWLECEVRPDVALARDHDLFIVEVVAAWADSDVWDGRELHFEGHPEKRTLHHVARGTFFATGERVKANEPG